MKRLLASGYFLVILSAIGFSIKSVLVKIAYGYGTDATTLVVLRVFIAMPLFLIVFFFVEGKNAFQVSIKELLIFLIMGLIGIGCPMLFSFYSIKFIDVSLSTLVIFTYPAMTLVMLIIFFRERFTVSKMISIIATFLGLILVVRIDNINFMAVNGKGIILGLLAAFCFSIYNILGEKVLKNLSPVKVITYCMSFLFGFLAFFFSSKLYPNTHEIWVISLLLGIFSTFLPFIFYIYGIKKIGAGKTVIISSLGPVFTVIWAYIILGERLTHTQIFGMAIIIFGVVNVKYNNLFLRLNRVQIFADKP